MNACKVWPTHELRSAQARALSQSVEYILPVRFDETEIPGLLNTVGYVVFTEQGVEGICASVLHKLKSPSLSEGRATPLPRGVQREPQEFWEQRRRLPDTDILKKVWSNPRWRIAMRPTELLLSSSDWQVVSWSGRRTSSGLSLSRAGLLGVETKA